MTLFLLVASILCLLAAVLIVLPVYRNQASSVDRSKVNVELFNERLEELGLEKERGLIDGQQFEAAVSELEKGLLTDISSSSAHADSELNQFDRKSSSKIYILLLTLLVIPLISFITYFQIGSFAEEKRWEQLQKEIKPALIGLERGEDKQRELAEYSIAEVIYVLQARLQQEEETPQGWMLLGLLYSQANKVDTASKAFEKALLLAPDHPEIKIVYAETLMRANQGRLTQRSAALLKSVLEKDGSNGKALTLLGMGSYNSGLYKQAIVAWEQLLEVRGNHHEKAPLIRQSIQMAQQALRQPAAAEKTNKQDKKSVSEGDELSPMLDRLQQLVMRDQRLTDEIEQLLVEVFSKQPENPRALAFEGMLSFNSGEYQRAINSWERLLKQREPGSERAKRIESSILKAKAKLDAQQ